MQDGPFFIMRLILIIEYNASAGLHIFFLCKNAIVCILLIYRIVVLVLEVDDDDDDEQE